MAGLSDNSKSREDGCEACIQSLMLPGSGHDMAFLPSIPNSVCLLSTPTSVEPSIVTNTTTPPPALCRHLHILWPVRTLPRPAPPTSVNSPIRVCPDVESSTMPSLTRLVVWKAQLVIMKEDRPPIGRCLLGPSCEKLGSSYSHSDKMQLLTSVTHRGDVWC